MIITFSVHNIPTPSQEPSFQPFVDSNTCFEKFSTSPVARDGNSRINCNIIDLGVTLVMGGTTYNLQVALAFSGLLWLENHVLLPLPR
ncbi:7220_t:CDS:2, partial [Funneliformis mosseae]